METISFSYNWNNKLTNKAFTTLRLHNPQKYKIGNCYKIEIKGEYVGVAKLTGVRTFTLANLNDFITYLDTGYNVRETITMLHTMYKNKVWDWPRQKFDFCLLVYEDSKIKKQLEPTLFEAEKHF